MDAAVPIIFLGLVLKIPVFFALWLIWWASRSYDEFAEDESSTGGQDHGFRRWRREPRPKGPRRGPHGGAAEPPGNCPPAGRRRGAPRPRPLPAPLSGHERRERSPKSA